jgi:uncharacterized caspase-like protein
MRYVAILLAMFYMFFGAEAASAGARVALVVGNGAYRKAEPLSNPPVSAQAMAALLRKTGFNVMEANDLTRDEMNQRLVEFGRKSAGADVALFYYSGHGIAVGGTEYLLPVDADVNSETDVKLSGAINVNLALDQAMNGAKVKLAFLDTSRSKPLPAPIPAPSKTRAFSVGDIKSPDNCLIVFASPPGDIAPDGPPGIIRPFTRALIANIATPGAEIQQAMAKVRAQMDQETDGKQMAWGNSNVLDDVYLSPLGSPRNGAATK